MLWFTSWWDGPPEAPVVRRSAEAYSPGRAYAKTLPMDVFVARIAGVNRGTAGAADRPCRPTLTVAGGATAVEFETVAIEVETLGEGIFQDAGVKLGVRELLDRAARAADEMMVVVAP